ncbi:MAG TPA: BON domain-containing protein [Chloroflexota bacterium]
MTDRDARYASRENQWDEAWPGTGEKVDRHPPEEIDTDGEVSPFPEISGTTDSLESTRDAEPYVPPSDPPVLPGGAEGIHMGVGFGFSAEEEAYSDPASRGDESIHDEAMRVLREDSLTSRYPLSITVNRGMVRLSGTVQSLEDAEYAMSLLGNLAGVVDVVDDTSLEPA